MLVAMIPFSSLYLTSLKDIIIQSQTITEGGGKGEEQ
jgi:hypothetical protein